MREPALSLGEFLRQRRLELGIEQQVLAERINRTAAQLVRWEKPSSPGWVPPYSVLIELARELRTPPGHLITLAFPDIDVTRPRLVGAEFFNHVEVLLRDAEVASAAKATFSLAIQMARSVEEAGRSVREEQQRLEDERERWRRQLNACLDDNERLRDEVESLKYE